MSVIQICNYTYVMFIVSSVNFKSFLVLVVWSLSKLFIPWFCGPLHNVSCLLSLPPFSFLFLFRPLSLPWHNVIIFTAPCPVPYRMDSLIPHCITTTHWMVLYKMYVNWTMCSFYYYTFIGLHMAWHNQQHQQQKAIVPLMFAVATHQENIPTQCGDNSHCHACPDSPSLEFPVTHSMCTCRSRLS